MRDIHSTLYCKLEKILGDLTKIPEHAEARVESTAMMSLHLDRLTKGDDIICIALSHTFKMNGDAVPDPDMEIAIDLKNKTVEALTYQDQFRYQVVYPRPGKVNPKLKTDLNNFLNTWLSNLDSQGYRFNLK